MAAWLESPHISGVGRKLAQTTGRSGLPKSKQRLSALNCTQRTPAGLPFGIPGIGDEIEGAMQHAPQPTRHSTANTLSQHTMSKLTPLAANTILYCQAWEETVAFYRDKLGLPITFASDWFVEFALTESARLSIANERRATIKSSHGAGITITLQVNDADAYWDAYHSEGLNPTPCRTHPWGARTFYLRDPEGNRLEIWSSLD